MLNIEKDQLLEWAFGLGLSREEQDQVVAIVAEQDSVEVPDELLKDEEDGKVDEASLDIGKLSIPQKIKLALFGNQTARRHLIQDTSSKQIPLFVLQNPRMTQGEIEEIARNTNVDDMLLRAIGANGQWMKNYQIKYSLVSNPKTPVDISLKWVKYLLDKDLKRLSSSKNIPQVIATHSRKLLEAKKTKPGAE